MFLALEKQDRYKIGIFIIQNLKEGEKAVAASIMNALGALNATIEKLDSIANKQEEKILELKQQDLFGAPIANDAQELDTEVMARKLDAVIDSVEQVLSEG